MTRIQGDSADLVTMGDEELLTIRVVSHRIIGDIAAYYTIHTTTTKTVHAVERRWNELRALYVELWAEWKPQLLRSGLKTPRFWQHSFRKGKNRLDKALLARREREMEALLRYFARALGLRLDYTATGGFQGPCVLYNFLVDAGTTSRPSAASDSESPALAAAAALPLAPGLHRRIKSARNVMLVAGAGVTGGRSPSVGDAGIFVDPPYGGRVSLTVEQLQAACDAPTPPMHWFQSSTGWPPDMAAQSKAGRAVCCQEWRRRRSIPTEQHSSTMADDMGSIGFLCIEVLEASG